MKCTKVVDYEAGSYSPAARDVRGFEIGVDHHFEQALLPHSGNWQSAKIFREGFAFKTCAYRRLSTAWRLRSSRDGALRFR
jgi:hypothetical protein